MDCEQVKTILQTARASGVKKIAFNGLEAEFFEGAPQAQEYLAADPDAASEIVADQDPDANLSYDEMLLRSSPAFDMIQAAKEEEKKGENK